MEKLGRYIIRFRWLIVTVIAIVTGFMGVQIPKLKVNVSLSYIF